MIERVYFVDWDDTTAVQPRPGWYAKTGQDHHPTGPFPSRQAAQEWIDAVDKYGADDDDEDCL